MVESKLCFWGAQRCVVVIIGIQKECTWLLSINQTADVSAKTQTSCTSSVGLRYFSRIRWPTFSPSYEDSLAAIRTECFGMNRLLNRQLRTHRYV